MRENLLKKQPTWGLRRAQGTGQKSATPATLTKVILVLLTMLLIPSVAWSVEVIKTITFNKQVGIVDGTNGTNIDRSAIPVSVSEKIGGTRYSYNSNVFILDDDAIEQYSSSSEGAVFKVRDDATSNMNAIQIIIPGNYPTVPTMVKLKFEYANAIPNTDVPDDNYNAIIQVCDYPLQDDDGELIYDDGELLDLRYTSQGSTLDKTGSPLIFTAGGEPVTVKDETFIGEGGTDRYGDPKSLWIMAYLDGNPKAEKEEERTTFTITEVEITYNINESDVYGLTVAGVPVTRVNKSAVFFDKDFMDWKENEGEDTGTVSFTPAEGSTPATLTLTGAVIEYNKGNVIVSTLTTPLAVNLSGNSNISSGPNLPFEGATGDNANLVFKCEDSGSLLMSSTHADFNTTHFYTGFNKVLYPEDEGNLYAYLSEDNVVIEPITSYGLTVAGVEVTSANCDDILKDDSYNAGKVSFKPAIYSQTPTPATLTLKGVTIEGRITWSDPEEGELSIIIDGDNAITNSGGALISFEGGSQTPPQLSLKAEGSGAKTLILQSDEFPISGFDNSSSPTIGAGLKAVSGQTYMGITTKDVYDLWIDGTQVHDIPELPGYKGNILGGTTATVTFDDGSQTLTLNNANITGIILSAIPLTIELTGDNYISSPSRAAIAQPTSASTPSTPEPLDLTIKPSSSDPLGSLTLTIRDGDVFIDNFNITLGGSLLTTGEIDNENEHQLTDYHTTGDHKTAVIASLIVGGTAVNGKNYNNILSGSGKVSFNSDGNVLTLEDITISTSFNSNYPSPIVSNLPNLTVSINGTCQLWGYGPQHMSNYPAFKSVRANAPLVLTSDNPDEKTDLQLNCNMNNIVDEGYFVLSTDNQMIIIDRSQYIGVEKIKSPTISKSDNTISFESGYSDVDGFEFYYTITDASGNKGTKTKFTEPLSISDPCTLEVTSKYQNQESDPRIGKYFAPKQEVYVMAIGEEVEDLVKADWFTPTIENSDDIGLSYWSESDIFDSSLEAKNTGTGIVTATLESSAIDILNPGDNVKLIFNVGEDLDEYFVDDNEYGTYYNEEENITYAVPEGMKAYIIKSVSDDGTVDLAESTVLSPKTPLLLKKGTAKSFTKISTSTGSAPSGNILKYAADWDQKPSATRSLYVLYNDKFVKVTNNTSVRERKCYLELSGSAGTRGFYNIGGGEGSTGIYAAPIFEEDATETGNSKGWHDLQGRKLQSKPTKAGLYILNGKKVVIK